MQGSTQLQSPTSRSAPSDSDIPAAQKAGWKTWLARVTLVLAIVLSAALLYRTLSAYDIGQLIDSVRAVPAVRLLIALGFAAASYFCLSVNDWLALFYARHPLPYRTAALTSFVALAFGHSIGFAALSSGAIRYRFYSRLGLGAEELAKIIVFCGATILLGLFVLGDVALFVHPDLAQRMIGLSRTATLLLAAVLALVPLAYVALACVLRHRVRLFRWSVEMPSPRLAVAQVILGSVNFLFVGACLYALVSAVGDVSYFDVLSAFVLANTATVITHAPGGLGVIETVVLMLLHMPGLIGPVLVFRFVYFLVPLALGSVVFAIAETSFRGPRSAAQTSTDRGGSGREARAGSEKRGEPDRSARIEHPRPQHQTRRAMM
jgi:uncharacterized membrane protein YbhN (UPF0104 family)